MVVNTDLSGMHDGGVDLGGYYVKYKSRSSCALTSLCNSVV